MSLYYVQTMPGIEEIAWLEIRQRFPAARFKEYQFAKDQNGIVIFEYDGDATDLLSLRCTEDIFIAAIVNPKVTRLRLDLTELTNSIPKSGDLGHAVNMFNRINRFTEPPTARIISRKYGEHPYRRIDLEMTVQKALQKRYGIWRWVEDNAQLEFWVNLLGSYLLCGIRLSDRTMRHRYTRAVELPASLRPSVAAAMVTLTEPQPEDTFMDAMCGSGTILLERHAAGPYQHLYGGDIDAERLSVARQNLEGLPRRLLTLQEWDAKKLPLEDGSIHKTAVNLPFGKQLGSPREIQKLYPAFLLELERVMAEKGTAVLLTSEFEFLKECVRQRPQLSIIRGYSIAVLGRWGRIYIIQKQTSG